MKRKVRKLTQKQVAAIEAKKGSYPGCKCVGVKSLARKYVPFMPSSCSLAQTHFATSPRRVSRFKFVREDGVDRVYWDGATGHYVRVPRVADQTTYENEPMDADYAFPEKASPRAQDDNRALSVWARNIAEGYNQDYGRRIDLRIKLLEMSAGLNLGLNWEDVDKAFQGWSPRSNKGIYLEEIKSMVDAAIKYRDIRYPEWVNTGR
jgi:hypothetical protein